MSGAGSRKCIPLLHFEKCILLLHPYATDMGWISVIRSVVGEVTRPANFVDASSMLHRLCCFGTTNTLVSTTHVRSLKTRSSRDRRLSGLFEIAASCIFVFLLEQVCSCSTCALQKQLASFLETLSLALTIPLRSSFTPH